MISCSFIFLDFDGVIKESVLVKTDAFESLFTKFGEQIVSRVRDHHKCNGGLSRYEKIPLYLEWAGEEGGIETVDHFCESFSTLVMQAVIDSPWVNGVQEFLDTNHKEKNIFLITATPQEEIEEILSALHIAHCFKEAYGAPTEKSEAMADIIKRYTIDALDAVMVGDSKNDYNAAKKNGVPFVLRRTPNNVDLQHSLECNMIDDFVSHNE